MHTDTYIDARMQHTHRHARTHSAGGRLQLIMRAPTIRCFAQSDMVHGCMVDTERAEMAAVSHGTISAVA